MEDADTKVISGYFYVRKPGYHRAAFGHWAKRADLVLEQKLGRLLSRDEIAHHKNRVRSDDSPENLEALTRSEHGRLHSKDPVVPRSIPVEHIKRQPKTPVPKRTNMKLTAEAERGIVSLYAEGLGMAAVAARLGISIGSVHRALKEAGIQSRPVGRRWPRKSPKKVE